MSYVSKAHFLVINTLRKKYVFPVIFIFSSISKTLVFFILFKSWLNIENRGYLPYYFYECNISKVWNKTFFTVFFFTVFMFVTNISIQNVLWTNLHRTYIVLCLYRDICSSKEQVYNKCVKYNSHILMENGRKMEKWKKFSKHL